MDAVGIERADRDDLFDLGDADLAAGRGRQVEVARRLAEHEVAALVRLPALDDAEVGADSALEHIGLPIEVFRLLALCDLSADTGLRIESGNSRAARAHPLGKRALRRELDLELPGEELPL